MQNKLLSRGICTANRIALPVRSGYRNDLNKAKMSAVRVSTVRDVTLHRSSHPTLYLPLQRWLGVGTGLSAICQAMESQIARW